MKIEAKQFELHGINLDIHFVRACTMHTLNAILHLKLHKNLVNAFHLQAKWVRRISRSRVVKVCESQFSVKI